MEEHVGLVAGWLVYVFVPWSVKWCDWVICVFACHVLDKCFHWSVGVWVLAASLFGSHRFCWKRVEMVSRCALEGLGQEVAG